MRAAGPAPRDRRSLYLMHRQLQVVLNDRALTEISIIGPGPVPGQFAISLD
jgi:type IV secretory pathway ATPase VirB11/archaellum biosynthesis ATPase